MGAEEAKGWEGGELERIKMNICARCCYETDRMGF